jgi:hypothetical protein
MRITNLVRRAAAGGLGATALTLTGLVNPAQAVPLETEVSCHVPESTAGSSARGGAHADHRDVSAAEQARIERRTARILEARGLSARGKPGSTATTVPVYVHVMRDSAGNGDVTNQQITDQIAVLNETFSGGESSTASDTGFRFTLAGIDRFNDDQWHKDRQSQGYRKATRQGGANALNMWLVDFNWLGIATFPWDYAKNPGIDGIRVHYASLPGGSIANYNLGETATHEAGHWFGLYHTFQGGCTETNDEVADTPAQSSYSTGCPEGNDTCPLPGLDPIHNYMDYSYDTCYTEFTAGQTARSQQMWAAYRG